MSRIGQNPIKIPSGVTVSQEGGNVIVRGSKGELRLSLSGGFSVRETDSFLLVEKPQTAVRETSAMWGLIRSLLANMVTGVTDGFSKRLLIEGVGYRAEIQGNDLVLYLGFSHPIRVVAPQDTRFSVEKNAITVFGIDKYVVGQLAANIRAHRKPEPYKGKGIRYEGEKIKRKAGKKAATGSAA